MVDLHRLDYKRMQKHAKHQADKCTEETEHVYLAEDVVARFLFVETEYAQYAEAKATLDACGISRQALTEEKADIYEQLAQLNKQIRAERQKIKLCREIADSAAVMQRDVAAQEKSLHEKETEHSFTNRR